MHLYSKAEELVREIQDQVDATTDLDKKQALEDVLGHANYLAQRLKEIGS
jgi:hypothetical protein